MQKIIGLKVVLQSPVSVRARKSVVRRYEELPFRNREIAVAIHIPVGSGSGANLAVRQAVSETLRTQVKKGEIMFYVVAEFGVLDSRGKIVHRYFRTVVPRSEIPIPFRRV